MEYKVRDGVHVLLSISARLSSAPVGKQHLKPIGFFKHTVLALIVKSTWQRHINHIITMVY